MASRKAAPAKADWRTVFRQSIARSLVIAAAVALGFFTLFLTVALVTYHGTDAAINTAAGGDPSNWMGGAGAWIADLMLFVGGGAIALLLPLLGIIAWRLWATTPQPYWAPARLRLHRHLVRRAGPAALGARQQRAAARRLGRDYRADRRRRRRSAV